MNILGEKVLLRAIEERDRDMFLELINDPDIERMIGGKSFPVSLIEQEEWIIKQSGSKSDLRCVVVLRDNEKQGLGTIILSNLDYKNGVCQVHIKMTKSEGQGKGYGTDALKTITKYAFNELRLNCIYADVLSYNSISQHLFEKCGYKKDGVLRSRVYKNGRYADVFSYSITKADMNHV